MKCKMTIHIWHKSAHDLLSTSNEITVIVRRLSNRFYCFSFIVFAQSKMTINKPKTYLRFNSNCHWVEYRADISRYFNVLFIQIFCRKMAKNVSIQHNTRAIRATCVRPLEPRTIVEYFRWFACTKCFRQFIDSKFYLLFFDLSPIQII